MHVLVNNIIKILKQINVKNALKIVFYALLHNIVFLALLIATLIRINAFKIALNTSLTILMHKATRDHAKCAILHALLVPMKKQIAVLAAKKVYIYQIKDV